MDTNTTNTLKPNGGCTTFVLTYTNNFNTDTLKRAKRSAFVYVTHKHRPGEEERKKKNKIDKYMNKHKIADCSLSRHLH